MNNRIEVGDIVSVNFNGSKYTLTGKAEVLAIACATGDSWIFKDVSTDKILYVSEGCTIELLKKKGNG
jgi:hypothetical protein